MKVKFFILATLSLFFTVGCHREDLEVQHDSIVILYENDVHCAIDGYAKMAGLRDVISDTAYVGMVSSGDYLQGNTVGPISTGVFIVDIMRQMHYDAVALGNHEFDYGMPTQLQLLRTLYAPVVCTNLYDMQGHRVYAPYVIRRYGDRKVAFVGVVTAESEEGAPYAFVSEGQQLYTLNGDRMAQLVQQSVNEARAQGSDYVVVLSHLGEEKVANYLTSHELVAATTGIDVVLDAHTHSVILCDTVMNAAGKPVYISQTGTQFVNVGKFVISKWGDFSFELIPTESTPYVNRAVARTTDSIRTLVNGLTGQKVFHTDYKLSIYDENGGREVRKAETNAGDLVTDAIRYVTDADLAFNNGGSFRGEIEPGDVTYGQVINMLPFDSRLVKIQATGAKVLEMLRLCTQNLPDESSEFPQVSGIRFTVQVVEGGDNVITSAEVLQPDGSYVPVNPSATYTIGLTDYCAYNGGFHNVFAGCTVLQSSLTLYRDVLVPYINQVYGGDVPPQYAQPQGRININSAKKTKPFQNSAKVRESV